MKKKLMNNSGITLVALVVTVIVLLILAGVSITMVFNSDGLFKKASETSEKYNQQKAEEALRVVLNDAQLEKYGSEGLDDEKLNEKIFEIGQVDEEDNSLVTVDRYIFKIDRSVPKILNYEGKSDKTIISYKINGNDKWIKEGEKSITIDVRIKDYSGELNIDSIKVMQDGVDITNSINNINTGSFTLETNKSTTYEITGDNIKGESVVSKEIVVKAKVDKVIPSAELDTEWVNENKKDLLKVVIRNIYDLDSGIKEIKLLVTREGEETEEQKLPIQNEIMYKISNINMESYTRLEIQISDNAGNVLVLKKNARRIYLVKNGIQIEKNTGGFAPLTYYGETPNHFIPKDGYIEITPQINTMVDSWKTNNKFKCFENTKVISNYILTEPQIGFDTNGSAMSKYITNSNDYLKAVYKGDKIVYPFKLNTELTSICNVNLSENSEFHPVFAIHRATAKLLNFYIEE